MRGCHHTQPVTNIFKLSDIPRKREVGQNGHRCSRNAFGIHAQLHGTLFQKEMGQDRDVFLSFSQGRQSQANHIEPVKQVFPEGAVLDALLKILVCRCNHSDIGFDAGVSTHAVIISIA